jgi:L-lactate dehydrogenase (cytochrome)
VDAVWVSNHAGRQFAGAPASLDALMAVRAAVGPDYPLILDGGIEGGLDVIRAIACGADFVMLGRAWHHGLAAAGAAGARHVHDILTADVVSNLGQLGVGRPDAATARLWSIEGLRAMT